MAGDAGDRAAAPALAHHQFNDLKPFFCQIEAVETAIWLTEVASDRAAAGAKIWTHIRGANKEANPELLRIALKLATRRRQRRRSWRA